LDAIAEKMKELAAVPRTLVAEDFEKDVDSNHHIDYITAGKKSVDECINPLLISIYSGEFAQCAVWSRPVGPSPYQEDCWQDHSRHGHFHCRRLWVPCDFTLLLLYIYISICRHDAIF